MIEFLWTNLDDTLTRRSPENVVLLTEQAVPNGLFGNKIAPGLDTLISIVVLVSGVVLTRRQPLWGILIALFVFQWLLVVPVERYVVAILPLLAFTWWQFADAFAQRCSVRVGNVIVAAMLTLWFGMNMARSVGVTIKQRRTPFLAYYRHGAYEGIRELASKLGRHVETDAWNVAPVRYASTVMFWSKRTVYVPLLLPKVDNAGNIYFIAPMDESQERLVRELGWHVGAPVLTIERSGVREPWTVHPVTKPSPHHE